jgi:hypothetical protein
MTETCTHWRTRVLVADGAVLCSGLYAASRGAAPGDACPAVGYYLDERWRADPPAAVAARPVHVDWPDFGVIQPERLAEVAAEVAGAIAAGQSVEIACLGGHGRTGTLLAAVIGHAEGLGAAAALREARRRYCPPAVATRAQVRLIYAALGAPPPPPEALLAGR